MTVLGGKQFLKQGYPEAIVKVVFFFIRFSSTLTGGRNGGGGGGGHLPRNCPNTFSQDCGSTIQQELNFY